MILAIKKNKDSYLILTSKNADRPYINHMVQISYELYKPGFSGRYPHLSEKKRRWLYYYIAQGCISIIIDWIDGGMEEDPREISEFIASIDDLILEHTFQINTNTESTVGK